MSTLIRVLKSVLVGVLPILLNADVTVLSLDTSGSMKYHGFEEAKSAILKTLNTIEGPVLITGFDVNDYEIWRGLISDSNRGASIKAIELKLTKLKPTGPYTHIEEAIDCGKVFLLSTKGSGARKLIIFSDGINRPQKDVDKYHNPVDLTQIAETIVPQNLGFSVYFIGLSPDLEIFFNAKVDSSGFIANQQYPHVKGIPLHDYNPSSVEDAFTKAVEDTPKQVEQQAPSDDRLKGLASWFKRHWLLVGVIILGIVFTIAIMSGNRNKIKENEEESKVKPEEIFEGVYEDSVQLIVQSADLPSISYPLTNGTTYMLGVDIPIPAIDYGIAIIKMQKGETTIEPLTTGFTINGSEFNGKVTFAMGDVIQIRDITINLTSIQQEDELFVTSSVAESIHEEQDNINLSDEDLNLF